MEEEQLALPGAAPARRRASRRPKPAASVHPVARVALMTPLPHLDRLFDYSVPVTLDEGAQPGARVRVRLAGRLVDGFVVERVEHSDHPLQPLVSVHGPPVLTEEIRALCRAVADRYAGTLADVLRSAVPPRHARAERAASARATSGEVSTGSARGTAGSDGAGAGIGADGLRPSATAQDPAPAWDAYQGGAELLAGLGGADPARALWICGPGEDPGARLAELAGVVLDRNRSVLIVVPDAADVTRFATALTAAGLTVATQTAEDGPERRYRTFLGALRGTTRVLVGTRTSIFAPMADLGAIVVWGDGEDSMAEQHAPGWHTREVAALRSAQSGAGLVLAGPGVTLETARMAGADWLAVVALPRAGVRERMPLVQVSADLLRGDPARGGRLPEEVTGVLRAGLAHGPVLVLVPRVGYLPGLACQTCREPAVCPVCDHALMATAKDRVPACPAHGPIPGWRCPRCGADRLRATAVGARRTAEELGRALPGVPVIVSTGESPVRSLARAPSLVVATAGAVPDPGPAGYAALAILDVTAALARPGSRVGEEVLRRWLESASLVRSAAQGGRVVVVGPADLREVQALVRWDPLGYAQRELAERRELGLPPAVRVAVLTGAPTATAELADQVCAELGRVVLRRSGPLPGSPLGEPDTTVYVLTAALADGPALTHSLALAKSVRSARKAPVVTVRMDPPELP